MTPKQAPQKEKHPSYPAPGKTGDSGGTSSRRTLQIGILIAFFVVLAFLIRTLLPFDEIFTESGIKLSSIDAYYQVGIVDNLVHNFPRLTEFQPFQVYPGGPGYGSIHFFNFLLAAIIWVIGLGSPSQQLIDTLSVLYPAALAALTVIPVYFIGKALGSRLMGVLAAGFFAVMPGEYLGRSILGFTDQHVMETLLTALAGLFFILAVKTARERGLTFRHVLDRDREIIVRPLVYSLLSSLVLGLYLITWQGALLFVFIISVYMVAQFIIDRLARRDTSYLAVTGFLALFPLPLALFVPAAPSMMYVYPLIIAIFIPVVLGGISYFFGNRGWHPAFYPLGLFGIAALGLVIFNFVAPSAFDFTFNLLSIFNPGGSSAATTMEMQPFLSPSGAFSTHVAWGNFTTSFFLFPWWPIPGFGLIALGIMAFISIKDRGMRGGLVFFVIWSAIILILTLVQRRFAYYLVVNISVLSAYLVWLVVQTILSHRKSELPKTSRKAGSPNALLRGQNAGYTALAAAMVLGLAIFIPSLDKSVDVAQNAAYAPSDAWQETLDWMETNTPAPFGTDEAYYGLYDKPARGESFDYPGSVYSVISWWDYGYWITRDAHRIPVANPSQDPDRIGPLAGLLLSTDETEWSPLLEDLAAGYVISDNTMTTTKFWAIATWAGQDPDDYTRIYAMERDGQMVGVTVYDLQYYRTLLSRLYNFDGKAVTEEGPMVIEYVERRGPGGAYREIISAREYNSYGAAVSFVEKQETGNYEIVGTNPLVSPVPLEELEDFELAYSSSQHAVIGSSLTVPAVKVYEYSPD